LLVFAVSSVEPPVLLPDMKTDLKEVVCEDGRWMKLAQDRVYWQVLISAMLKIVVRTRRKLDLNSQLKSV
jgi:hypothetical protein